MLRIMISLLSESKNFPSLSNKEIIILTIGAIAAKYKDKLLDPIDKPPSVLKSITKLNDIVFRFLKVYHKIGKLYYYSRSLLICSH